MVGSSWVHPAGKVDHFLGLMCDKRRDAGKSMSQRHVENALVDQRLDAD
jgi:hypothetical protein